VRLWREVRRRRTGGGGARKDSGEIKKTAEDERFYEGLDPLDAW
jgi:hypothetical protein